MKASKGKDARDFVRKVTFTADGEMDEFKLSLITYALMPLTKDTRDAEFDAWLIKRLNDYCCKNNLKVVKAS